MSRALLLRIFSRRKLSQCFCNPSSSSSSPPLALTRPSSTLVLARSFHGKAFTFEDRKKTSFAHQQPLGSSSSGVLLCSRHIYSSSSEPEESNIKLDTFGDVFPEKPVEATEESSIKLDAFGDVVVPEKPVEAIEESSSIKLDAFGDVFPVEAAKEESSSIEFDVFGDVVVVPEEKSVEEAMVAATEEFNLSAYCGQYVISAIHDLTGFNWSMSVVITALLMSGLMYRFPQEIRRLALEIQRLALELKSLGMSIEKVRRMMEARDDPIHLLYLQAFGSCCWYYLNLCNAHLVITMMFINGIDNMAKKSPGGFIDLSALDRYYMFPLVTGFAFWLTSKDPTMSLPKIISRAKKTLPFYCIFFILVQAAYYEYDPAVCVYLIPYRLSLYALHLMSRSKQVAELRRSKQIAELRKALGVFWYGEDDWKNKIDNK